MVWDWRKCLMNKMFAECVNEEERQEVRDRYLEIIYHQTIVQNGHIANIQERLKKLEEKIELMNRLKLQELSGIDAEDIYNLFK